MIKFDSKRFKLLINSVENKSELCRMLGISNQTLYNWVNGKNMIPLDKAYIICLYLNFPINELFIDI